MNADEHKRQNNISTIGIHSKYKSHYQKSSLQILRSEQPLLKATIREQSEKIAKLEDRIVQLEQKLAMNKIADVGENAISKEALSFKEDGKFQFVIHRDNHNMLEHHIYLQLLQHQVWIKVGTSL